MLDERCGFCFGRGRVVGMLYLRCRYIVIFCLVYVGTASFAPAQPTCVVDINSGRCSLQFASSSGASPLSCNPDSFRLFREGGSVLEPLPVNATRRVKNLGRARAKVRMRLKYLRIERTTALTGHNKARARKLRRRILLLRVQLRRHLDEIRFIQFCRSGQFNRAKLFFDADGLPTIDAPTDRAALFALGWAHMSYRSFQMFVRRAQAQGRLSEFFGPSFGGVDLVNLDKRARVLAFQSVAEVSLARLDAETQVLLTAYAEGVNARLDEMRMLPAPQAYVSTGTSLSMFEPWKPEDALLVFMSFAQYFTGDPYELPNRGLFLADVAVHGFAEARERWLNPHFVADGCVLQRASINEGEVFGSHGRNLGPELTASHGVVVRDAEGAKLLGMPMLDLKFRDWAPAQILSPSFRSQGAMLFGAPIVWVGGNDRVAWTLTSAGSDLSDYFELTIDPNDDERYLLDGVSVPLSPRIERIAVRNHSDVEFVVRESYFGPIVNEAFGLPPVPVLAQRHIMRDAYVFSPSVHPIRGWMRLMRARSMDDLREAVLEIDYPSAHLLAASAPQGGNERGDILYVHTARVPKRSPDSPLGGLIPQDGSTRSRDWMGLVDNTRRPSLLNPTSGVLVAANGCTSDDPATDIHYLSGLGDSNRGWQLRRRLRAALENDSVVTIEELDEIRQDCEAIGLSHFRRVYQHLRDRFPNIISDHPAIRNAMTYLDAIDTPSSRADGEHVALVVTTLSIMRELVRGTRFAREQYQGSPSALEAFFDLFEISPELALDHSEYLDDWGRYVSDVLRLSWERTVAVPTATGGAGYGPPSTWEENYSTGVPLPWTPFNRITAQSIDSQFDITSGFVPCNHSGTIWSQPADVFTILQHMDGVSAPAIKFAPGMEVDNPQSAHFADQIADWKLGRMRKLSDDYEDVVEKCRRKQPDVGCSERLLSPPPRME